MTDEPNAPDVRQIIGSNIARLRGESETMAAFGQRMGEVLPTPWSRQMVWQAQQGQRSFTVVDLLALSIVLGVNVEELLRTDAHSFKLGDSEFPASTLPLLLGSTSAEADRSRRVHAIVKALSKTRRDVSKAASEQAVLLEALGAALAGRGDIEALEEALQLVEGFEESSKPRSAL